MRGIPRHERVWFARLAWWLTLLSLAGLAVPVLSRLTGFEWGPLSYVVPLVPWVTIVLLVPLVVAVLLRSWPMVGAAGALFAMCIAWIAPLYVGSGGDGEPVMTVATINAHFGDADPDAIVTLVSSNDIDLLSIQEVTPALAEALESAGLNELLPFSEVRAELSFTGTGLWSRHPISEAESLDGYRSRNIRASVQTPLGDVTVYSVHPGAPHLSTQAWWLSDMARLAEELDGATGPVIVMGDFNASRDHRLFRDIEALGYIDTMNQAGAGFLPTFPVERGGWELVTLDHVMTRDAPLLAIDVRTMAVPKADHRAVIVTFVASADTAARDLPVG